MGNTYEVSIWQYDAELEKYRYNSVYRGESFLRMLYVAWQYKHKGIGCVKMEWR